MKCILTCADVGTYCFFNIARSCRSEWLKGFHKKNYSMKTSNSIFLQVSYFRFNFLKEVEKGVKILKTVQGIGCSWSDYQRVDSCILWYLVCFHFDITFTLFVVTFLVASSKICRYSMSAKLIVTLIFLHKNILSWVFLQSCFVTIF